MELRALAERVLFSPSLSDKLTSPGELTDERPPSRFEIPPLPARPPGLALDDGRERARFPSPAELGEAKARGRALHFFANHELLAIELMAVCLLRFPRAPPAFRMGVGRTLLEEQDHLRRYRARMAELGVALGDVPVGGQFWRALSGMTHPLDYVTGMSLVFEQANLDHAARWARFFEAAGDLASASLMRSILDDEIGHVKHGVVWFERWRPHGDPFEAFAASLPPGLDPVRARGPEVEVEPRRRAGLSDGFIRRLRLHRGPKGRRPRLFVMAPDVEDHLAGRTTPSRRVEALTADLAHVLGLLGRDDDLVLTPVLPSAPYRERLAAAGLPTPVTIQRLEDAAGYRPDSVHAWGLSPEVRRRLVPILRSVRLPLPDLDDARLLHKGLALLPRARLVADGLLDAALVGWLARSSREVVEARARVDGPIVLKAAHAASGRRRRIVEGPLDAEAERFVERVVGREGAILVEPWLDRLSDFGLVIPSVGAPSLLRFVTDTGGAYRGHVLGPPALGLSPEIAEALGRWPGGLRGLVERIALEARREVPEGPAGVDLLAYRDRAGAARLFPMVEINARHTMGHVAAALRAHIAPGRVGIWWHARTSDLPGGPAEGFEAIADRMERGAPIRASIRGSRRVLEEGVIATNDPSSCRQVLTLLSVAGDLETARAQLYPLDVSA